MKSFLKLPLLLSLFISAAFFASCSSSNSGKVNHTEFCRAKYEVAEEYYKKGNTKEGLVYLYNGDQPPIPIVEQYQTQDLTQTMQNCIDLMSSTIGVAAQGINPAQNSKTATEILIQNNNSESNVESLYLHAQDACREITKSVLEALCYEQDLQIPTFKLINGPEVITKNMKRRQELLAVSNLVDRLD